MSKKPVILCVDDEPAILDSLKIELYKALGKRYLVETTEGGKEALEVIEELLEDNVDIPLVISDYIMPQMKGDELLKRIHAITPNTLKVMLTGQASIEAVTNAINQAQLYRYIAKPWNAEDLKLTVTQALRSYFQNKHIEQSAKTRATLIKAYERSVPRQFLSLLNKNSILDIELGDHIEKEMTILFADIRGFTSLSEILSLQDNFEFLNNYLGQMEPIITTHHGFIDKYIGDAIMALFMHANDAVSAGIAMLKKLTEYNQFLQMAGFKPLNIGIGINTGPLMLGVLGGQERMEGTVIADAVNVSSRVEALTKIYDSTLLITENTYQKLENISQYCMRVVDHVTVKGKTKPVTVYEVFDADLPAIIELKSITLPDFEQGFQYFHHEKFEEAQHCFEKVLQINKKDKAAQIYSKHCQQVLSMTMPEKPKILIVDDTPAHVQVLTNFFVLTNQFEVLAAENGKTGLKIAESKHPHLILLDINMPDIDGFETCKRLKANIKTQDIPIIFITALLKTEDKIKGFQLGAVDYITKPFEVEEVLSRTKTHLNFHYLQQQLQARDVELEINNLKLKEKINTLLKQTKLL